VGPPGTTHSKGAGWPGGPLGAIFFARDASIGHNSGPGRRPPWRGGPRFSVATAGWIAGGNDRQQQASITSAHAFRIIRRSVLRAVRVRTAPHPPACARRGRFPPGRRLPMAVWVPGYWIYGPPFSFFLSFGSYSGIAANWENSRAYAHSYVGGGPLGEEIRGDRYVYVPSLLAVMIHLAGFERIAASAFVKIDWPWPRFRAKRSVDLFSGAASRSPSATPYDDQAATASRRGTEVYFRELHQQYDWMVSAHRTNNAVSRAPHAELRRTTSGWRRPRRGARRERASFPPRPARPQGAPSTSSGFGCKRFPPAAPQPYANHVSPNRNGQHPARMAFVATLPAGACSPFKGPPKNRDAGKAPQLGKGAHRQRQLRRGKKVAMRLIESPDVEPFLKASGS